MSSSPHTGTRDYEAMRNLDWSPAEKAVARKAFNQALHSELEGVMVEAKKRAERIQQPSADQGLPSDARAGDGFPRLVKTRVGGRLDGSQSRSA